MALRKIQNSSRIDKHALKHFDKEMAVKITEDTVKEAMIKIIKELPLSDLACIFPFAIYNENDCVKIEVKTEVSNLGKHTFEAFENKLNAIIKTL